MLTPYFEVYHASAGCGKTATLINRVVEALQNGYEPEEIAFVTFTRVAADVAKRRIAERTGLSIRRFMHFSTIHSMVFRSLGLEKGTMMDGERLKEFADSLGEKYVPSGAEDMLDLDWEALKFNDMLNLEQLYRNNRKMFEQVREVTFDNGRLVWFMRQYQQYKSAHGYLDFTDILEEYVERDLEQTGVRLACLDEMQDSTALQWRVVMKAYRNAERILVAGDDKQTLYSSFGADPNVLINLKGEQHTLSKSYRVPKKILSFVQEKIIDTMEEVYPTPNDTVVEGGSVEQIDSLDDVPYDKDKTYFIIAPSKALLKPYVAYLREKGIAYTLRGIEYPKKKDLMHVAEMTSRNFDTAYTYEADFITQCVKDEGLNVEEFNSMPKEKRASALFALSAAKAQKLAPRVRVDTIYSVKGDEADNVVVISDVPTRLARSMNRGEQGLEEAHRLFYVACTRAKEALYIVGPETKHYYPYIL